MAHWQTSWKHKRYDYKRLIEDYKAGRTLEVKNSKGMAKMKVVPHIGDTVDVSCNKKKIMKCSVISEFEEEENGGYDEYCIGAKETHDYMQNNICLRLRIMEVYDNPEVLNGLQRTWVKK